MSAVFDNDLVVAILTGALLESSLADEDAQIAVLKSGTEAGADPGEWAVQVDAAADEDYYILKRVRRPKEEETNDSSDDGAS